ncbi:MAG: DivIVA domain-containing protein [Balneolales bacterium]
MNLTALEIKQQTFEKSLRGYDITEVKGFLKLISTEWEHLVTKTKDQESEINRLKDKLKHYEKVEESLHETLESAKSSAEQRIKGATLESDTKVQKAELEAEKIVQTAQNQRREIRMGILKLLDRREEMIRGMKSYLDMAGESLESFTRDEASIYKAPKLEDEPVQKYEPIQTEEPAAQPKNQDENPQQTAFQDGKDAENRDQEDKKVKYFSTDPDDMDDLLDEID